MASHFYKKGIMTEEERKIQRIIENEERKTKKLYKTFEGWVTKEQLLAIRKHNKEALSGKKDYLFYK
jgi:hypothetical protein